jgi:hypothetical protein
MKSQLLATADKTSGLPVISMSPPLVRVTVASLEERNVLLQNGLDFYGATFFPTEAAEATGVLRTSGRKSFLGNRYSSSYYRGTKPVWRRGRIPRRQTVQQ